jgi:2-polyprenyl-6-methoxyphenol hydroxylase-like FAD-dependent oxidoreductase
MDIELVDVVGAGPAGLAAEITFARAGRRVIVHEAQKEVGHRFRRDLQGIYNWTTSGDVLVELEGMGITTAFEKVPCFKGIAFDDRKRSYPVNSRLPIFYMAIAAVCTRRASWLRHQSTPLVITHGLDSNACGFGNIPDGHAGFLHTMTSQIGRS